MIDKLASLFEVPAKWSIKLSERYPLPVGIILLALAFFYPVPNAYSTNVIVALSLILIFWIGCVFCWIGLLRLANRGNK